MTEQQWTCIRSVHARKGPIFPVASTQHRWDKCFTSYKNATLFWFDTPDRSSHVVKLEEELGEK